MSATGRPHQALRECTAGTWQVPERMLGSRYFFPG